MEGGIGELVPHPHTQKNPHTHSDTIFRIPTFFWENFSTFSFCNIFIFLFVFMYTDINTDINTDSIYIYGKFIRYPTTHDHDSNNSIISIITII